MLYRGLSADPDRIPSGMLSLQPRPDESRPSPERNRMTAPNNKKTLIAVLGPLSMGILLALGFLYYYLSKKSVILTIRNDTGVALQGGEVLLASELKAEEIGPISAGDSIVFRFSNGGSGEYTLTGKRVDGAEFTVKGGLVPEGKSARDRLVLVMEGDSTARRVAGRFTQAQP